MKWHKFEVSLVVVALVVFTVGVLRYVSGVDISQPVMVFMAHPAVISPNYAIAVGFVGLFGFMAFVFRA